VTSREILIGGAIVYWCEGAKRKPHNPSERVKSAMTAGRRLTDTKAASQIMSGTAAEWWGTAAEWSGTAAEWSGTAAESSATAAEWSGTVMGAV
jgi:hypothetical protein